MTLGGKNEGEKMDLSEKKAERKHDILNIGASLGVVANLWEQTG